jgi:hypothetical protein
LGGTHGYFLTDWPVNGFVFIEFADGLWGAKYADCLSFA